MRSFQGAPSTAVAPACACVYVRVRACVCVRVCACVLCMVCALARVRDLKQNGASIHSFHLPYKLSMACKVALISA